jgi:vacuolar protein sorting-associated protein VTA1
MGTDICLKKFEMTSGELSNSLNEHLPMNTIPTALKPVAPFVLRGREVLKGGNEVIAYHCFRYAVVQGMKLPKTAEGQAFLMELMTELEKLKPLVSNRTPEDLKITCETFANAVFHGADVVDRAGNADKSTAQTFYASASFFELLKQFQEPGEEEDEELKQQIIYCKWKATDILKAIKEGRKPHAGPLEEEDNVHDDADEDIPLAKPAPAAAAPPPQFKQPTSHHQPARTSISKSAKADALELIRFAKAAIEAEDIQVAVDRLQACLNVLQEM